MHNDQAKNKFENFESEYEREFMLQRELEKVELAYAKTVEKYGEYGDCKSFVEYLRTVEKIFLEAKIKNWDAEKSKDELISAKIKMMAAESSIEEDILNSIYSDFKKSNISVGKIYDITNSLIEKYKDNRECSELILYIQHIFITFADAKKEGIGMEELEDRLVRARMDVLSSDGDPNLITLEKIYQEFKKLLNNENI